MYNFKGLSDEMLHLKEQELNGRIDSALFIMELVEELDDWYDELEAVKKEQKSREK